MAVIDVALDVIDDNPYNPRKHYPQAKVNEMAQSLREVGLRQVPEGRHVDGRVQLAYGHMRKRGYLQNQKKDAEHWKMMPVDVKEITDQDMFHYSMEENLRRTDITPLEVARCIESLSMWFPDMLDEEIGQKHSMSAQNVSNMKRVLRLPQKFLDKIDEGVLSFSQGRELLTMERLPDAENLMSAAVTGLKTDIRKWGEPNTLEGLQKSIHRVINNHFPPLDKEFAGYRYDLLFDTQAAGCIQCEKRVRTHPNKSQTAYFCSDEQCWQAKQTEHRELAATEARAKMEAEVIDRAAQVIAQEEKTPLPAPVMIDEHTICVDSETLAKLEASNSCDRISEGTAVRKPVEFEGKLYVATSSGMGKVEAYHVVPAEQFTGAPRTYRIPAGRKDDEYYESLRNDPNGFYHGMSVKRGKSDHVLVGPEVTFVTKVDEGDFSREKSTGQVAAADETDRFLEKLATKSKAKRKPLPVVTDTTGVALPIPCDLCAKAETCDRTYFHVATDGSGQLVCEKKVKRAPEEVKVPPPEIPEDILALAREKAGTRAEVLDLNDICGGGGYYRQIKQGYADLSAELRLVDDPAECLERCTHGFHYAFDSKAKEQTVLHICSDTKCLGKKKSTFTRAKNADGQARKKAETKAIKEAIDLVGQVISDGKQLLDEGGKFTNTVIVPRATLKLILLAQMDGQHCTRYYYGEGKKPEKWLWDKVSAGVPENDRSREKLFKTIDKLTDDELVKLVVEFMFYYLTDKGDIGSYEIKSTEPLKWMGIDIKMEAG